MSSQINNILLRRIYNYRAGAVRFHLLFCIIFAHTWTFRFAITSFSFHGIIRTQVALARTVIQLDKYVNVNVSTCDKVMHGHASLLGRIFQLETNICRENKFTTRKEVLKDIVNIYTGNVIGAIN